MKNTIALMIIFFLGLMTTYAQKKKEQPNIAPKDIFIPELLSKMTLDEKAEPNPGLDIMLEGMEWPKAKDIADRIALSLGVKCE